MKLSEIYSRLTDPYPLDDGWLAVCPSHDDHAPSLAVTLKDDGRVLFHCRAGCSWADVSNALGLPGAGVRDVEVDMSIEASSNANDPVSPVATAILKQYLTEANDALSTTSSKVSKDALAYVKKRFGLAADDAISIGLGVDDGSIASVFTGQRWTMTPRLVVPFLDFDGLPVGGQGRDLYDADEHRWCSLSSPKDGGKWSPLAVFMQSHGLDTFLVTEGPGDALTAFAAGYHAIGVRGAALGGASRTRELLVDGLAGRRVVLVGDDDDAGRTFVRAAASALADGGIEAFVLELPDDVSDLSEWCEARPSTFASELREAVDQAKVFSTAPEVEAPMPTDRQGILDSLGGFELTDVGNAQRVKARFDGNLRYSPEVGFYTFDGRTWHHDRFDSVRTAAQSIGLELEREGRRYINSGDAAISATGKELIRWGNYSQSSRGIDAMLKELKVLRDIPIDVESFDTRHHLLAFENGVVNLKTGELLPHDREYLQTRRIGFEYDPTATCPRWERFLAEIFPDDPTIPPYLQRLIGYGITGETSEQCFAIFYGTGANGKSVFTDTLAHTFAPISNTTPFSTFERKPSGGIPNDIAALKGSRLVFASEGEQGVPMAEATLKRATGQDLLTARLMRKEFFSFRPTHLIMLATNHKPSFRGQDEGLWRRVKLLPFERYFAPDERDHYLIETLRGEAQGIIAWAVRGAVEWYRAGLMDPEKVVTATESYREVSDVLDGFFPGIFERGTSTDHVLGADVYRRYHQWTEDEELPSREVWSRKALYAALDERGAYRKKTKKGIAIFGIVLADPSDDDDTSTDDTPVATPREVPASNTDTSLAGIFGEEKETS